MAIQPDGPSSKYNASHHTTPFFATRKRTSTSVAARLGRANLRTDYRRVTQSRRPPASDVSSVRHTPFGRKRRGPLAASRPGASAGPTRREIGDASRVAPIRGPSQAGLPGAPGDAISPPMFVVAEADAAAIRAVFDQEGELSAAIELRRRFPGITDNAKARACARTIAGWKPPPGAGISGDAAASALGTLEGFLD